MTPPTNCVNLAHGKHPVNWVSTQGNEKLGLMVERPWLLTWDTMVYVTVNCNI